MTTILYKALDLYKLTTRGTLNKTYLGYSDQSSTSTVYGYVINSKELKKSVMHKIMLFNPDTEITEKILSSNYVLFLIDKNSKIVEGTLLFGDTKEILEKFHKKISGQRYREYFKDNFIIAFEEINTISNEFEDENFDNFPKKSSKETLTSLGNYSVKDLKGNFDKSRTFLEKANNVSVGERVSKMGEISEALYNYGEELKKENVSKNTLREILNLNFGGDRVLTLKEKALNILESLKLKDISKDSKLNRIEQLREAN